MSTVFLSPGDTNSLHIVNETNSCDVDHSNSRPSPIPERVHSLHRHPNMGIKRTSLKLNLQNTELIVRFTSVDFGSMSQCCQGKRDKELLWEEGCDCRSPESLNLRFLSLLLPPLMRRRRNVLSPLCAFSVYGVCFVRRLYQLSLAIGANA